MVEYKTPRTNADLMAQIGWLFMAWGRIERVLLVLSRRLSLPNAKPTSPFKNRLEDWCDALKGKFLNDRFANDIDELATDICNVRDLRNLIGHGFVSSYAFRDQVSEPFLKARTFVAGDQKVCRVLYSELYAKIVLAEQVPSRLRNLTSIALDPPALPKALISG